MLRPTPGDPRGAEQHHWNTSEVSGSHASRVSATVAIKRAKADAERARLDYAEKEADLYI